MIAVIFEVKLKPDSKDQYLDLAAELKNILSDMPGFISIERFQSLTTPERLLSLSFWQDQQAVIAWRNQLMHKKAQHLGRNELFSDYRIRVAEVLRDYGMNTRAQAANEQ